MRWAELNLTDGLWTLPAGRTKSGCAHVLPLSAQAIVLIKGLPKLNDYLVFPARGKNTSVSGYSKWKAGLDEAAGLTDWRLHDLRRTAATKMAGLKIAYEVREPILNHTLRGLEAVCNRHPYETEMREALERWSTFIQQEIILSSNRRPALGGQ